MRPGIALLEGFCPAAVLRIRWAEEPLASGTGGVFLVRCYVRCLGLRRGEEDFEAARAEGRSMTFEQAVAYALEDRDAQPN